MIVSRAFAAAVAVAGVALFAAPVAAASPEDDAFLSVLDGQGIAYPSADYAVATAKDVCNYLDNGSSFVSIVSEISANSGLPAEDTGFFVGASIASYCPWHEGAIGG